MLAILKKRCDNLQNYIVKAVRELSPIHRMAPWLRTYGSYQGRECSTRPCHGSGYAHSTLEHSQLTYGDAIGMSGMQLLRCLYCAIPGPCPTPPWSPVVSSPAHFRPPFCKGPLQNGGRKWAGDETTICVRACV